MKSPLNLWLSAAIAVLVTGLAASSVVAGPFDGSPPAEHPGFWVFENTYSARLNLKPGEEITTGHIEEYIGISRDYNRSLCHPSKHRASGGLKRRLRR